MDSKIKELADEYIAKNHNKLSVKQMNNLMYHSGIEEYLKQTGKKFANLSKRDLETMICTLRKKTDNGVMPLTFSQFTVLHSMLFYIYENLNPLRNPMAQLKVNDLMAFYYEQAGNHSESLIEMMDKEILSRAIPENLKKYTRCMVRLYYNGWMPEDLMHMREEDINFETGITSMPGGYDLKVDAETLKLLREVHGMDSISSNERNVPLVSYNNSYWKFSTEDSEFDNTPESDVKRKLSVFYNRQVKEDFTDITPKILQRQGFYKYLCDKYGESVAHQMIYENQRHLNVILKKEMAAYGLATTTNNLTMAKRSMIQSLAY